MVVAEISPELRPADVPAGAVEGLYVHIPFCFHKCHYCDFYSITRQSESRRERFVDLLLEEADLWKQARGRISPRTVFFGGGTPTLLPREAMRRLMEGLRERFDLIDCDEWTIEANPATVDVEYCRMMRECGANRISFGAQSFHRAELAFLERRHDPPEVRRSIEAARSAGFERLNVDLIYGIPGQTPVSWAESLEAAIELGTEHVSCYGLTYEPNTALAVRKRLRQFQAVDEELELAMMWAARARLQVAGLAAYEISNYSRPGKECRHNINYWTGGNYLGIGPAAASHCSGWRWRNRPHLAEWESAVAGGRLPAIEVETLSPARRVGELAMLMLRLSRGFEFAVCSERTGLDGRDIFAKVVDRLGKMGLIVADDRAIRLTKTGVNVADTIASEFLAAVE